jgi:hypothetical protein
MSSKRHIRQKACTGKVRYETREAAEHARHMANTPGINVYRCRWCGGWHQGHRPISVGRP